VCQSLLYYKLELGLLLNYNYTHIIYLFTQSGNFKVLDEIINSACFDVKDAIITASWWFAFLCTRNAFYHNKVYTTMPTSFTVETVVFKTINY